MGLHIKLQDICRRSLAPIVAGLLFPVFSPVTLFLVRLAASSVSMAFLMTNVHDNISEFDMINRIQIGDLRADVNQKIFGHLKVSELSDGSPANCPVILINGKEKGPTLFLGGGVHGDEYTGIEVARRISSIETKDLNGALIIIPIQNIVAFLGHDRFTPGDIHDQDLGEMLHGSADGPTTDRIAHTLLNEAILKSDYAIDIHSCASWGRNVTYAVVPEQEKIDQAIELARMFGPDAIIRKRQSHWPANVAGMKGVASIMVESGEGGKMDREAIGRCYDGVINVMKYLKMIKGSPEVKKPVMVTETCTIRPKTGGLLSLDVSLGNKVEKGAIVGRIFGFHNREEVIMAPQDGTVMRVFTKAWCQPGDRILVTYR